MKYTVYNPTTGAVLRWGACQDEMLTAQARSGRSEAVISGEFPGGQFYWDCQAAAMTAFPERPSETASWNWEAKAWQVDLAAAREARWTQMKEARRQAIDAPLVTPYGIFDCDAEARDNIAKTAQGVQTFAGSFAPTELPTVSYTLWDNSVATLDAQDMINVAKLLFEKTQAAYARGRAVRDAIDAADTLTQIEDVAW